MTDASGTVPPFPGFAGFPGFPAADMLERMWDMMRATPFGGVLPGSAPGGAAGFGPSLSMMSDMMAPLTSVEELDKRITDLRAVEQWLKLNLNMLQSAIQALEVQRATLATLRAFGAYAQAQMTPAPSAGAPADFSAPASANAGEKAEAGRSDESAEPAAPPGFDASAWWNLLQAQFNQLAQFAMTPPAAKPDSPADEAPNPAEKPAADQRAAAKPAAAAKKTARRTSSSQTAGSSSPARGKPKRSPQPD